jgi:hypothetical protein
MAENTIINVTSACEASSETDSTYHIREFTVTSTTDTSSRPIYSPCFQHSNDNIRVTSQSTIQATYHWSHLLFTGQSNTIC